MSRFAVLTVHATGPVEVRLDYAADNGRLLTALSGRRPTWDPAAKCWRVERESAVALVRGLRSNGFTVTLHGADDHPHLAAYAREDATAELARLALLEREACLHAQAAALEVLSAGGDDLGAELAGDSAWLRSVGISW